ncbi:MAG: Maf family nucleotide pyrophosphatase [Cyclobacteriaceae bacterium]
MFPKKHYILASGSPRRQMILDEAGLDFEVKVADIHEDFPADMPVVNVARYLAEKKANQFPYLKDDELVITADTTVVVDDIILNKPVDYQDAFDMLRCISGRSHTVITGVCLKTREKTISFDDNTLVTFKALSNEEIDYYIQQHEPFDKAGAYGIQEWIGMIGVTTMQGSYFNVMGMPVHKLYEVLHKEFRDVDI